MIKSFEANCIGHARVLSELFPLLKGGDHLKRVVNISARTGSIGDNNLGGWYSYRMSKAALNMLTKTAANELKRFNCSVISLHPGTVDTEMSKLFQKSVPKGHLFTPTHSVDQMLKVIWAMNKETTGSFLAYDGKKVEW
jgi:NAD(P)-dependent dehydrogenase (short-subunit alcohol dehydrogenase family)